LEIAKHILSDGGIEEQDFSRIVGSLEEEERLLSINIFAKVPLSNTVRFQSKPAELVAKRMVEEALSSGKL